ncbi:MAG: DUF4259 domain-containing protein [Deltaproteobacteria bacterium]|nr:DUF4259 domain-containing protein [Deltaproteobacteria bacterium]
MGTWGRGPFENDAAGDFADTLARGGLNKIRKALRSSSTDADDCAEAVAAAACVAAARGQAVAGFPEELAPRLPAWNKQLVDDDVRLAKQRLAQLAKDSELAELWRASDAAGWARALGELRAQLDRAPKPLVRAPKPRLRKVAVGDVFRVALDGDRWAAAKVLHLSTYWKSQVLVGVYPAGESSGPMVGVVSMHIRPLRAGEWPFLERAPVTREEVASLQGRVHALLKLDLESPEVSIAEDDETELGLCFAKAAQREVAELALQRA